jgi:hypothetical protein
MPVSAGQPPLKLLYTALVTVSSTCLTQLIEHHTYCMLVALPQRAEVSVSAPVTDTSAPMLIVVSDCCDRRTARSTSATSCVRTPATGQQPPLEQLRFASW